MKTLKFILAFISLTAVIISSCKKKDEITDQNEITYKIGTTTYTVDKEAKTVTIKDFGTGTGTVTFSADTTYVIEGRVYVNTGQTLTIEPGTMIQGLPGQGENSSALVVAQGGKIMAEGTAEQPIVFTGYGDTYEGTGVYVTKVRGLWGGLIILGKAVTNNAAQMRVEGLPADEARGVYGGTDNADNSGILKYVSIRHGGTEIGSGNEINGLTLGGVGSGTTIDYVEVVSNLDDGIEFFGGTVNVKHALITYCGDDSYDYDQGYQGKGQFWVAVQDWKIGDRLAEQDGGDGDGETAAPETQSQPVIYNATYIGNGKTPLMIFRDNAGGTYANSIFAYTADGVRIETRTDKHSSYEMFNEGLLVIKNNLFDHVGDGSAAKSMFVKPEEGFVEPDGADNNAATHWTNNYNTAENIGISADSEEEFSAYIPANSSTATRASKPADAFFEQADYHGAFQPGGTDWTQGWTLSFK